MERLVVFPPFPSLLPLFISVTGACLLEDMVAYGWVVRFLPAISAVSLLELAGCQFLFICLSRLKFLAAVQLMWTCYTHPPIHDKGQP